jgi:hypothetical protein
MTTWRARTLHVSSFVILAKARIQAVFAMFWIADLCATQSLPSNVVVEGPNDETVASQVT